jgi:hypothetical protein
MAEHRFSNRVGWSRICLPIEVTHLAEDGQHHGMADFPDHLVETA